MEQGKKTPTEDVEQERAERMRRFRGQPEREDAASREYWRTASSAEHARAMIELSRYAERMAAQTGFTRDKNEPLPRLVPRRQAGDTA